MKLLALNCPQCGQRLAPQNEAIVFRCQNCLTAVHLDDHGLQAIAVRYIAPPPDKQIATWLSVWVFSGSVKITRRHTQKGRGKRRSIDEANLFWGSISQFFVPAWQLDWREAQSIGSRLIQAQPEYETYTGDTTQPFMTVVTDGADAQKLLEFIILSHEAHEKDWLKDLRFTLDLQPPDLWAFPGLGNKLIV